MPMDTRAAVPWLVLAGCAAGPATQIPELALGDPARRERPAPLVLDAITETATGRLLTPDELARQLAGVRLVFVGETHGDPHAHEAQRRLVQALADTGRRVLVGLEMLPAPEQGALDLWVDGGLEEDAFLRLSGWYRHWGHPFAYYREIFRLARARGIRLFAVNAPREVVTAARRKGFEGLSPEEARHLPPRVDTDSPEHRRLFSAYFAAAGAAHGGLTEEQWEGMYRAQCAWDAAMASHALRALERHGDAGAIMVVLLGQGHVAFGLGAPRQAALWSSAPLATVIPVPIRDEEGRPARARASYADYLWAVPPAPRPPLIPELGAFLAERPEGPTVMSVEAGSAAAGAGLAAGDRVLSVDGTPVTDRESYLRLVSDRRWGDGLTLEVERAGARLTLRAVLRRPAPAGP